MNNAMHDGIIILGCPRSGTTNSASAPGFDAVRQSIGVIGKAVVYRAILAVTFVALLATRRVSVSRG